MNELAIRTGGSWLLGLLLAAGGGPGCGGPAFVEDLAAVDLGQPDELGPAREDAARGAVDPGAPDTAEELADAVHAAPDTGGAEPAFDLARADSDGGPEAGREPPPELGEPWDDLPWRSIRAMADPRADCGPGDPTCAVDLLDLRVAVGPELLAVDLQFTAAFPTGDGSLEVFFIPRDQRVLGRTVRYNYGYWEFWTADCTSVAPEQKHSGCHWQADRLPDSFVFRWGPAGHVFFQVSLNELGLAEQDSLLMGVAAAPTWIRRTAEFTDRHPDELWVTATSITGLAEVPLRP